MNFPFKAAVGHPVVPVCFEEGIQVSEVGNHLVPCLVHDGKDLELGHLLFSELVDLVHLAHKVKRFGLVGDDDIYCPALFLLSFGCQPNVMMWVMLGTYAW